MHDCVQIRITLKSCREQTKPNKCLTKRKVLQEPLWTVLEHDNLSNGEYCRGKKRKREGKFSIDSREDGSVFSLESRGIWEGDDMPDTGQLLQQPPKRKEV